MLTKTLTHFMGSLGKFKGAPRIRNHFLDVFKPTGLFHCQTRQGIRLRVNLKDVVEKMYWIGVHPEDFSIVSDLLRPGDTFIDVGANIGTWTVFAARTVGTTGKVISYEPSPVTYPRLRNHVTLNQVTEIVQPIHSAVGNFVGETQFFHDVDHAGASRICKTEKNGYTIPITSLNESLQGVRPNLIKIDVEGHEAEVISGAKKIISEHLPQIILEYNPHIIGRPISLTEFDPYRQLSALGYKVYHCESLETLQEGLLNPSWSSNRFTNLLFKHPSTEEERSPSSIKFDGC